MPTHRLAHPAILIGVLVTAMTGWCADTPIYREKLNVMVYRDAAGVDRPVKTAEDWAIRRAHILGEVQVVMGEMPPETRRVALDVQVAEEVAGDKWTRRRLTYAPEAGDRVPAYLFIPKGLKGKVPAVLCLHQTTGIGKGEPADLGGLDNLHYARELAERGFVTLAPDYPNFGDYAFDPYANGYASASMKGIWNHRRALDLLQSLPEVDADRLGCIGHSLGGHNTLFLAAFDERVKVAVTSCGFNSFTRYMGGDLTGWSHKGYMPRIADVYHCRADEMPFDFTEVLAAIAPRAVFINAPTADDNFALDGVKDCLTAAGPVYALLGAADKLVAEHPECAHDFLPGTRERAYQFIARFLYNEREGDNMLRITEPFHGAVLNRRHGRQGDDSLTITVSGEAPPYGQVTVNGTPAAVKGGQFTVPVTVTAAEQDLTAVYEGTFGHQEHTVRVVWDRYSRPRYRFSIDDNSFWLRDIAQQGYASLFDCFYLEILRRLNREYGARFTVNIYYETDDGFQITDFPDRYRGEFAENADWLVLSFHARANLPDRPYQYTAAETLIHDLDLVEEQIVRFAGEQTLAPPTVIHWGMIQPAALKPLYDHGVRVLSGFAHPTAHGYDVNYWLDDARSEYLWQHEALKDFASGIVFSRVDIICNNTPVDRVAATLQPCFDNAEQAEYMDLFTHEQYFWPFYVNYVPDHAERLDATIRWVTERGYQPVFFHEGFLGGPAW